MRAIHHLLGAGLLLAVVACNLETRDDPQATNGVLLIVVDTLRRDHLGAYGYERDTSPNLDELAARSTLYRSAYSHAPWTTPAIAALMTSRHPEALGIRDRQSRLAEEFVSLPEVLQEAGWTTGAIVSHSFCSSRWGFAQGFDSFDESNIKGPFATTSQDVSELAIDWIDAHHERPFFLFLHYFDPHAAYVQREGFEFREKGESRYEGRLGSVVIPERFAMDPSRLRPADLREMERLYDSEIALTDRWIGAVLDHLEEVGVLEQTLVIITADHGEEFLDHGALDHAKTLYDELVRVPLIVHYPGRTATVSERIVGLVDVLPTVLDAAGLAAPAGIRGHSLLDGPTREIVYLETERLRRLRGVVKDGHKLIVDRDGGAVELYDLVADPSEHENLAAQRPELVAELRALLGALVDAPPTRKPADEVKLTDEERERLRALGYM